MMALLKDFRGSRGLSVLKSIGSSVIDVSLLVISVISTFVLAFIELLSWVLLHFSNKIGMRVLYDIDECHFQLL